MTRNLVVSDETHSSIFSLKGHLQIKNYQKFRNIDNVITELIKNYRDKDMPEVIKIMDGMYQLEEKE